MAVDIAVVGGGVAGLTAALFAARHGRSTLALIPLMPGGHIATIDHVEDFPGFPTGVAGYELGPAIQQQAQDAGAEFMMAAATGLAPADGGYVIATNDGDVEARTVIIASGSRPRKLGVPGEDRFEGWGISHCASCDGPMIRGKPVVVVGAGDSGLQEALTLADFACEVLVLERSGVPAAQAVYQARIHENQRITVRSSTTVEEVLGETSVTGVRLRGAGLIETAALFIYVGLEPNTAWLQDNPTLDESGHIPTDIWMRTSLPGVFAAGDVRAGSASQAITAAGDGATAAIAAHRYLLESSP